MGTKKGRIYSKEAPQRFGGGQLPKLLPLGSATVLEYITIDWLFQWPLQRVHLLILSRAVLRLLWEIKRGFFPTSVFKYWYEYNWFSFVVYAKILLCFKKVNSALGKHQTKFLLNQMRQTGIKHWRVARKISWCLSKNFSRWFSLLFPEKSAQLSKCP